MKAHRGKPVTGVDDPRHTKALSHPMRVRILAMLRESPASPVQLSERLPDASLGAIAYHVRTLHGLGLLELVTTRQRRGATEHVYSAVDQPQLTGESWAELGPVSKQRLLGAVLQEIGDYAADSAAAGGFDRADAHITRTALKLDAHAWGKLAEATKKWLREVERIEEAAGRRLQRSSDGDETVDVGLVLMLFEAMPFSSRPR